MVNIFKESWKNERWDLEILIYINNVFLEYIKVDFYIIVVVVLVID